MNRHFIQNDKNIDASDLANNPPARTGGAIPDTLEFCKKNRLLPKALSNI